MNITAVIYILLILLGALIGVPIFEFFCGYLSRVEYVFVVKDGGGRFRFATHDEAEEFNEFIDSLGR